MTGERRPFLDAAARTRIGEAIRRAETETAGEIVVLVAARAGVYRSAPLLLALAAGLAVPWPLIALTPWSAAAIALAQVAVVLLTLLAGLHPRIRLALVPRVIRRERAHEQALREFTTRGLSRTEGRTGVLIYVARAEGHAEIVADHGVAARVPPAAWAGAIETLLAALRRGEAEAGLTTVVAQVGTILAGPLPPEARPVDVLPNRVIELD
ncbi:TPM domain-containing protein [Methylobacterium sp. M6A4_1b]